jgi:predicted nucleic acid-binding protein
MDVLLDTNILIHIAQKEKDFLKIYKVTKKSNVTF